MKFCEKGDVDQICKWAEVPRSSFYYKAHPGPRGMKPSTHTRKNGDSVPNEDVVEEIRRILGQDYCVYGYQMTTTELRGLGYLINEKKVYRLMDENKLLWGKVIRTKGKREWVKFRRIDATRPMQYLCLDIKYVWVRGENRWYYQLAVIDVFSRMIIAWIFQPSIRQKDVVAMMRHLDLRYGLKGVIIRNDNGSQFIANQVRQTLIDLEARQEFTHVATPEENAYIESFHSIEQRELMDRFTFNSFYDAKTRIEKYMRWYNTVRRHGQLDGLTPAQKWAQGWAWSLVRQQFEPASDDMSRPDSASRWQRPLRIALTWHPKRTTFASRASKQRWN
jgi:transposase InsO family protein